jgi:ABC-type spermidine/putrescine transport system permease subunit II
MRVGDYFNNLHALIGWLVIAFVGGCVMTVFGDGLSYLFKDGRETVLFFTIVTPFALPPLAFGVYFLIKGARMEERDRRLEERRYRERGPEK